ncbi:MAG TPA: hypothetical protein VMV56_07515 [Williamwhitmania sp.]|nr:hypothetical protein [Williamwhitmania sp.]
MEYYLVIDKTPAARYPDWAAMLIDIGNMKHRINIDESWEIYSDWWDEPKYICTVGEMFAKAHYGI